MSVAISEDLKKFLGDIAGAQSKSEASSIAKKMGNMSPQIAAQLGSIPGGGGKLLTNTGTLRQQYNDAEFEAAKQLAQSLVSKLKQAQNGMVESKKSIPDTEPPSQDIDSGAGSGGGSGSGSENLANMLRDYGTFTRNLSTAGAINNYSSSFAEKKIGNLVLPLLKQGDAYNKYKGVIPSNAYGSLNDDWLSLRSSTGLVPRYDSANLKGFSSLQSYINGYSKVGFDESSELKANPNWEWKDGKYVPKDPVLSKRFNNILSAPSRFSRAFASSGSIISAKMTLDQMSQYLPTLVNTLVQTNEDFSKAGIGPISKSSLPFYAGRWIDPYTGRIRLLPKASQKYLNPISYNAKKSYLEARILNNWNSYVESEESYLKFLNKTPEEYETKEKKKIQSTFNAERTKQAYKKAVKWYKTEIAGYDAGFPMISKSSKIVLGTIKSQNDANYKDLLKILAEIPDDAEVTADKLNEINGILNNQLGILLTTMGPPTFQNQKLQASIMDAYQTWMAKGFGPQERGLITLAKTALPDQLTEEIIMQVDKLFETRKSLATARVTNLQNTINSMAGISGDNLGKMRSLEAFIGAKDAIVPQANARKITIPPSETYEFNFPAFGRPYTKLL